MTIQSIQNVPAQVAIVVYLKLSDSVNMADEEMEDIEGHALFVIPSTNNLFSDPLHSSHLIFPNNWPLIHSAFPLAMGRTVFSTKKIHRLRS